MKSIKLFVLLTFCITFLSAEIIKITNESYKNSQKILLKKDVENELKTILYKVKAYKKEKNQQIITLKKKFSSLKKSFHHYKSTKKHEILQLKKKNVQRKYQIKKLNNKEKKIKNLQYELALLKQQLRQKKQTIISLKEKLIKENQPILLSTNIEETPPQKWIKITVNNNLNIYDLALKYYGDSQEYEKIYMANQNKIDKNYQIRNGMSLKIPITENFIEQPMFINTN